MAGTDTVRGITFQHAFAVLVSVESLSDPHVAQLRFEGASDCVDLEALDAEGTLIWGLQAKTRQEGTQWNLSDLKPVLQAWFSTAPPDGCRFRFVTDGQLGKGGLRLRRAINQVTRGEKSTELDDVLAELGLTEAQIGSLTLSTREGDPDTLLWPEPLVVVHLLCESDAPRWGEGGPRHGQEKAAYA